MEEILRKSILTILLIALSAKFSEGCNEELCASVVSKCTILKSCDCDMKDFSCRKECIKCLSDYHGECCSCVGMCSADDEDDSLPSNVGELSESVPTLFEALTSDRDPLHRWFAYSFPIYYSSVLSDKFKYDVEPEVGSDKKDDISAVSVNCTVAYQSQCMSWHKCRMSCQSMGAATYRWFHDGCCECVGENCANYGINENRCPNCPINKGQYSVDDNKLDFGEDMDD